jgi:beta-carotene hydroxylase
MLQRNLAALFAPYRGMLPSICRETSNDGGMTHSNKNSHGSVEDKTFRTLASDDITLPPLRDFAGDLTRISRPRLVWSLMLPILWIALYFLFATWRWWPLAVACLVCLSFVTYGSISHDLVHRSLGLHKWINDFFLTLIELLALRSGHAYRMAHLHHHALFPHDDDIEGAAARMSLTRTLMEGVIFQFKIWWWAVRRSHKDRRLILLEGLGSLSLIGLSVALYPVTPIFLVYVVLMIMGSWIIPLITSYVPHDPGGDNELLQTRLFRGKVASLIAIEHLYHLEHHLYPAVPHHHWARLAKRLDPFFAKAGIQPIKFWF